jgi:subtilisin-like proprotein convertase family protein
VASTNQHNAKVNKWDIGQFSNNDELKTQIQSFNKKQNMKKAANTATDFMPKEKTEFSVNNQSYDMRTNKNQGMFSSFEPPERMKKDKIENDATD